MRKICLVAVVLVVSFIANSQLQFAGSLTISPTDGGTVLGIRSTGSTKTLHNFVVTDPKNYWTTFLTQGPDGRIYGMTDGGGANHRGTVYAMNADGSGFTVLYNIPTSPTSGGYSKPCFGPDGKLYIYISGSICKMNLDGSGFSSIVSTPYLNRMVFDDDGWIYGIARDGVSLQEFILKVRTDGTGYNIMHTLTPSEGSMSNYGLTLTPTGRLFGLCYHGGAYNRGSLFSIRTDGTDFTVNKSFGDVIGLGVNPQSMPLYKEGKIWGTTSTGGSFGRGVIFSFDTATSIYTTIYNSSQKSLYCGLTAGADGKLYSIAGLFDQIVYSIDPDGQNYQEIYSPYPFGDMIPANNDAPLYISASNKLVTMLYNGKKILSMGTDGQNAAAIHNFGYAPNGDSPIALIKDASNKLYGVTSAGGVSSGGIIFKMDYSGAGFTQLYDFTGPQAQVPLGKMTLASDGRLYGLCKINTGGQPTAGIYRINTDGSGFELIKVFSYTTEGAMIRSGHLIEGPSGELFGMLADPTNANVVRIYKIQKDGSNFTVLKTFSTAEGARPEEGLLLVNGFLYGACRQGGNNNGGTVFRIALNGTGFQLLRHFTWQNNDGYLPSCGLMVASNGKIYGGTATTQVVGGGAIFSMNPDGSGYSVVHTFAYSDPYTTTGWMLESRMIEGSDGKLYGLSGSGGLGIRPTSFFSMNLDGTGFTIKDFDAALGRIGSGELVEIPLLTLPVKLNYFTAKEKEGKVTLNWATSEEENSNKYIVERSADGAHFIPIATVKASGNVSTLTSYSTDDLNPVKGRNYYRLQMIDIDGSFKRSSIQLVDLSKDKEGLRIYPNPANEELTIESNLKGRNLSITITDITGKTIKKYILANTSYIKVDVTSLTKGMYTLSIDDGAMTKSKLFIKE